MAVGLRTHHAVLDLLNACVAVVHGLTLATHNTRDFPNVVGLCLVDRLTPGTDIASERMDDLDTLNAVWPVQNGGQMGR